MTLVLQLIQSAGKTSTIVEDAFMVVSAMINGTSPLLLFRTLHLVLIYNIYCSS